ncbi:MAG: hypothetical protein PHU07_03070 [Acidocella sp.]|nr:hypothetical protein [Acidocella sp.]
MSGIYAEGMDALSRAKRIIFSLRAPRGATTTGNLPGTATR